MAFDNPNIVFGATGLQGESSTNPTAIDYSKNGQPIIYVTQQDGMIYRYEIDRLPDNNGDNNDEFVVTDTVAINDIKNLTQNYNDDGTINNTQTRQITGLVVTKDDAGNDVVYVSSSDWRIAVGDDSGLDTNAGHIHRLIIDPDGNVLSNVAVLRGLPRSEENHSTNGLDISIDPVTGDAILWIAQGGNTNKGAPGNNFSGTVDFALSGTILKVNLTDLESYDVRIDANGDPYILDLPTLDDPTRDNVDLVADLGLDPNDIPDNFTIDQGPDGQEGNPDWAGGNNGLNMAKITEKVLVSIDGELTFVDNPLAIHSPGFRNQYDVLVTEAGEVYTWDNGPNGGWGGQPLSNSDGQIVDDWTSELATNQFNENGSDGFGDQLHYLGNATDQYGPYGGDANPIRASAEAVRAAFNPDGSYKGASASDPIVVDGAELFANEAAARDYLNKLLIIYEEQGDGNWVDVTGETGLPADFFDVVSGYTWSHPGSSINDPTDFYDGTSVMDDTVYSPESQLLDQNNDGSLVTVNASTNGIAEYTGTFFGGALQGAIIAASFNGNLYFEKPVDTDGDGRTDAVESLGTIGGFGSQPLGVTALGDGGFSDDVLIDDNNDGVDDFAGIVIAATYGADNVTIFVPGGSPSDPSTDLDLDGVNNTVDTHVGDPTDGKGVRVAADETELWHFELNNPDTTPPGARPNGDSISGDIGINAVWQNGTTPQVTEDGTGALYDPGVWNLGGASTIVSIDEADTGSAEGAANDQHDVLGLGFATEPGTGAVSIVTEGKNIFTYSLNNGKTWDGGEKWGLVVGPGNQSTFAQAAIVVRDVGGTLQYGVELLVEENDVNTSVFVEIPGIEDPTIFGVGDPSFQVAIDLDLSFGGASAVARARYVEDGNYTEWVETGALALPADVVDAVKGNYANAGKQTGAFVGLLSTAATGDDSFGADWDFVEVTGSPIEYGDGEVLYRWNAGGSDVAANDGGPDWVTTGATVTGSAAQSTQNGAQNGLDASVPATAPAALYTQELYGNDGAAPMGLEFGNGTLAAGNYAVRLYMANGYDGTSEPGERVFDVSVENQLFLDDLDLSATLGHKVGGMFEWVGSVTDGTLDIDFTHVTENPLINAVEVIALGSGNPAVTVADATVGEDAGTLNVSISAAPFPPADEDILITYEIRPVPGGATPEVDYTVPGASYNAATGVYTAQGTIAGGSGDFTFPVTIIADEESEGAEVFQVVLTSVNGADATIADSVALVTIEDDGAVGGTILYRVNSGGAEVAATDGGPAWSADTPEANSPHLVNAGSNNDYPTDGVPFTGIDTSQVDEYGVPEAVLGIERWDNTTDAAGEMAYSFDVAAGTDVEIRIYLAENFADLPDADASGDPTGDRVFSVSVDGAVPEAFQDIDPYALGGDFNVGSVVTYRTTSDGAINLEFLHGVENPAVKGIEIVALGDLAQLSIGAPTPASVEETGDTGVTTLAFPLTFDTSPTSYVEVVYSVDINGTVTTGLTQALGVTDGAILVDVPNDDIANGEETVTVTVTGFVTGGDVAYLGETVASATVTEDDSGLGPVVVAINAGGPALSQDGIDFEADTGFVNGTAFEDGATVDVNNGNGAQPAFDGTIYETERYGGADGGTLSYELAVGEGEFTVELHFAEIFQNSEGARVFDVSIEGQLVLDDFDILAENGGDINAPVVITVPGSFDPASFDNLDALDIDFSASADNAKISGIVVREAGGTAPTGGAATLTVNNGNNDIEASNYGNDSFQITNVGNKDIAYIELDVSGALLPDAVFDPFGLAGDNVGKILTLNNGTDGGTGLVVPQGGFGTGAIDVVYLGSGGIDGYEKIRLEFNDFNPGETISFGVDMDPNSIAGSDKGTLDSGAGLAGAGNWDVGGIGGAELSGSLFTVGYTDGTSSTGQLMGQGTGEQMGSEARSSQDSPDLAVSLTVNGLDGGEGSYSDGGPQVLIEGPAGETARILLAKGFIVPFTNEFTGAYADQLDAQLAALEASGFPANNVVETQYVDIVLTGEVQDISSLFDFTQVSAYDLSVPDQVNEYGTLDEAQLPLGFVASVIDPATDEPKGAVTTPIHLTYAEVVEADLSLTKTVSDETPVVGDTVTFELTVTNDGNSQATGVTVEDLLANGYAFVEASGDGSYDPETGLWTVGAIADGGSATLQITAEVLEDAAAEDTVVYRVNPGGTAQASANGTGPDWLGDDAAQLNGNPPTSEDIGTGITLTGGNKYGDENGDPVIDLSLLPGDTAANEVLFQTERYGVPAVNGEVLYPQAWDFLVENGDYTVNLFFVEIFQDAVGERLFDVEIEGALVLDDYDIYADVGQNVAVMKSFDTTVSDGNLDIDFTTVVDNAKISAIEIIAKGSPPSEYGNAAQILTSDQDDPDSTPGNGQVGEDDDASIVVTPVTTADLELSKTVSDPTPAYGDTVTFTLTVDHVDGVAATGVSVKDLLPSGFTYVGDDSGGAYDAETGVWTIGAIARGGSATLQITAEVNGPIVLDAETTLYRVNVGGDQVAAVDGGDPWSADTQANPSEYLVGGDSNFFNGTSGSAHPGAIDFTAFPDLAGEVPAEVFEYERWDPDTGGEMAWSFPVVEGTEVLVRLYVAELYNGVTAAGQRSFDVSVEGVVPAAFDDIDPYALAGPKGAAVVEATLTVDDGFLDLLLLHGVENPAIKGIEVIALNDTTPIPADYTNKAEILTADQADPDSTPGDGSEGDDDDVSVIVNATAGGENIATIALVADAAEPGTDGSFLVTLEEAVAVDTTITYEVTGTATNGTDYATLTGTLVIAAGASSGTIDVSVIDDLDIEGDETVVVTLTGVSAGDTNVVIGAADEASLAIAEDDVPALRLGALVEVTPDTGLDASTYSASSFQITNTGEAGTQITSVKIDLSTAIMPDMVFDPTGAGGDATASAFTPNTGGTATGVIVPGNPAADPFSEPHNGGFDVITVNFDDFDAGETFTFTTDVDPNSIQGVPGAGNAGAVSGYELTGATVTVTFANGETVTGSLFEDGSLGGSQALIEKDTPPAPTIGVVGVATDESTLPGSQITVGGEPTIRISGNEGEYVALLQMDSRLYIASGEPPFDVGASELPFYANEAMAGKAVYTGQIGAEGYIDIPVTLFATDSGNATPDGGLNQFVAVTSATPYSPDQPTSMTSNILTLRQFAPLIYDAPGVMEFSGSNADVVELPLDPDWLVPEGTIAFSFAAVDTNGLQGIFSRDGRFYGGGGHTAVYLDGDSLIARFQDADSEVLLTFDGIVPGEEYEIAATFGPGGVALWVNGNLVASDDSFPISWEGNEEYMQWGGLGWASNGAGPGFSNPFEGTISDKQIYSEVLTASEIAALAGTSAGSNNPPVAVDDAVSVGEDGSVNFDPAANDSDTDGGTVAVSGIASGPANGSAVVESDGTVTYTPDADFNGEDSFEVIVTDGQGGSATSTVSVTVDPVNDDPVAADDAGEVVIGEAVILDVLGNDGDVDLDTLTVFSVTDGAAGTVTINPDGTLTYTHDGVSPVGEDTFTYTVSDGNGGEDTATVTVTVTEEPNAEPVAVADLIALVEDGSITYQPGDNDTDGNGDTVVASAIASGPANGTAVVNPDGTVTYTPDADFFGADSFEVTVTDGNGGFDTAVTNVTVDPVNDEPVASDDTSQVVVGAAVVIDVLANDTDVDPDTLTVLSVTNGTAGTVSINPDGTLTYTHDGVSPAGEDTFTYTVSDGNGGEDTATVTVDVLAEPNTAPVAVADLVSVLEDGSITYQPGDNDSDVNGDTVVASAIASGPANGTAVVNPDGSVTYTPDADFNGADSFEVTVTDGNGGFDTAVTNVTVAPVNDPPVANDDAASTSQDTAVVIDLLGNDTDDGDGASTLFISSLGAAANGTVVDNGNGTVTYTPNAGTSGADSFTYEVSDGEFTDTATVNVDVSSFPTPIVSLPGSANFNGTNSSVIQLPHDPALEIAQGTVNFEFNAGDTNGQQGLFAKDASFYGGGGHTVLYLNGSTLVARFQDDDSEVIFQYGGIVAGEDYEVAATFGPDGVGLWVNGTLVGSDDFAISWEGNDEWIQWGGRGWGSQTGQPGFDAPFNGTITDREIYGVALSAAEIADLHSDGPPNGDPVAVDDTLVVAEDGSGSLDPVANDIDPDGDTVTASAIASGASNGTAVLNPDGTVTYTPDVNFFGDDAFSVLVTDGKGGFDTSVVDVTVTPVADDPVANDDVATTEVDTAVTIDLTQNDSDPDGDTLLVQAIANVVGGSVTDNGDGTVLFTPDVGFTGTGGFTYEVADGTGRTDGASVNVTVSAEPTAPTPVFTQVGVSSYSGSSGDVDNYAPDPALEIEEGTIAFSFVDDNPGQRQGLVVKDARGYDGGGNHFAAYIDKGDLHVRFQSANAETTLSFDDLVAGQEYEVAATFGDDGVALFVNGELVGTNSGLTMDWTANNEWLQVGGLGWGSATGDDAFGNPFSGEIADVEIYDEVLTEDLIEQLANQSSFDLII